MFVTSSGRNPKTILLCCCCFIWSLLWFCTCSFDIAQYCACIWVHHKLYILLHRFNVTVPFVSFVYDSFIRFLQFHTVITLHTYLYFLSFLSSLHMSQYYPTHNISSFHPDTPFRRIVNRSCCNAHVSRGFASRFTPDKKEDGLAVVE